MIATQTRSRKNTWSYHAGYEDRVAAAVAESHPDRALAVYERGLSGRLPQADQAAYEDCARILKKMRPIYVALGRAADWEQRIAEIRQKHGNCRRFMEILDKLEGRTILQSQRVRATGNRAHRR